MSRDLKDTPQKMTSDTLDYNLEWAKRKRSGILATMTKIEEELKRSLKKPEEYGTYESRSHVIRPIYNFDLARAEIKRLDWVIGLIEKDIKAAA